MPRERLRSAGAAALTDAELLALLLATGTRQQPVTVLATDLLRAGGGLRRLSAMPSGQLQRCSGLGPAKASRIAAAFEIGRRVAQRPLPAGVPIASAADVAAHFEPHLRDRKQEIFLTLLLDGRHRLLRAVRVAEGCLTAAIVHPREALRPGVIEAAAALIFVHNHPSGDPTPSPEDLALTRKLVRAAQLLAIDVLDHVIIGDGVHVSLASEGLMEPLGEPDLAASLY
jgi:DNA repair protein RadC